MSKGSGTRADFMEDLSAFYREKGFDIIAQDQAFPKNSGETIGEVDLLLEHSDDSNYKIVEATNTGTLDPLTLEDYVCKNKEQAEKARNYFRDKLDTPEIDKEIVISTKDDLRTVYNLWENTNGVFTWNQALDAVSNNGRLANLKDKDYLILNHGVSRREDEEYFELSPELETVTDIFYEHTVYP